ncbi:MAG: C4-dicarboxylate ABC transporter substrate-binding protein [Deltaproteobacteria bacterium HGW-Deltaproteobacteria-21]|jgi:TRAP-type C4-dicarboxylate transport system substrate-binding protein|nr:MAG: C4-dicarboxylate ABC transporter substrate-binding protein [Deltaproteobacteria bacterium HGW-Deltaproteobacteria-21]
MKKRFMVKAFVFLMALGFLFVSIPLYAQDKEIKLRYSVIWPPMHPITKLMVEWGKDVEKVTQGRIKTTMFASNTLSPPMQAYDATVKGVVDVAGNLLAYSPGRLPLSEVLQQPLGYRNGYQASKLANAYYKKFKPKEFDDVKVMYLHGAAPGFIMTKKPIKTAADIKGLRIKANAENADIVKNLGGAPVTMPVSETYDALSRGVVDGTLFPVEALQGFKIGEVVKTVLEDYGVSYMTSMYVAMNKDKWNSISPEDQKAIEKINEEYNEKLAKLWVELDNKAKEFAIGKGVTFVTVSEKEQAATVEKMKPIWDAYVNMAKSKGLPGDEALKFCLDYLKNNP